jgi:predicted TIM-barrel fold metal-dependent hydrolase
LIFDWDRHAALSDYAELLPYMKASWAKHFERSEFLGSIAESSNHIRLSGQWGLAPVSAPPHTEADSSLLVPHQGLTINGWADQVAATVFAGAVNGYAREHWATERQSPVILVSPHDPAWSAEEIRRQAGVGGFGAIALPFGPVLFGSIHYDRVYDAASEVGLPIVAHYSGVEGCYSGAAPLSGGVHTSAFSRKVLMPQVAESNISSLAFEGAFERFPGLRFLFSGVGFTWLPNLLWRLDREWRTFRHDVPWVKQPPSSYVLKRVWATTWPIREATLAGEWQRLFADESFRSRVVFGSHDPFDGDSAAHLREQLGEADGALVLGNGAQLLPLAQAVRG